MLPPELTEAFDAHITATRALLTKLTNAATVASLMTDDESVDELRRLTRRSSVTLPVLDEVTRRANALISEFERLTDPAQVFGFDLV